jgi:NarL family two-component system response regulator LiaR
MAPTPQPKTKELNFDERLVLELLAKGYVNKEIAQMLEISYDSVKWHVRSMRMKLNLETRVELAVYAAKQGWV